MKLNAKFLTAAALAASVLTTSFVSPANAGWSPFGRNSVCLGFGCHGSGYEGGGSSLQVMTDEYWDFRVANLTKYNITYKINGEDFLLTPNTHRDHRYRKEYGTNSNNIRSYPKPRIEFDSDANSPGWQTVAYDIGGNKYFKEYSYGHVDLYN